jgi:hypothetical protein
MTLQQPFLDPGLFFNFVIFFTQMVRHLGRGISPSQGHYLHTGEHKHRIKNYRHLCLEWDSKLQSQRSSERRQFMPYTARPQLSAIRCIGVLNLKYAVKTKKLVNDSRFTHRWLCKTFKQRSSCTIRGSHSGGYVRRSNKEVRARFEVHTAVVM